jgi:hypothetical protein
MGDSFFYGNIAREFAGPWDRERGRGMMHKGTARRFGEVQV